MAVLSWIIVVPISLKAWMKIGLCLFISKSVSAHLKQKHAEMCAQCVTCVIYKPPLFLGLLRAQQPPLNHVDHLNDMSNITKSAFWIQTAFACVPTTWEFGAFPPRVGGLRPDAFSHRRSAWSARRLTVADCMLEMYMKGSDRHWRRGGI